jgi:hypothetical protein
MQEDQAAQVDDERDTTAEALAADSTTEAEAQPADDGSGDGGAAADASGDDVGMAGAVDDRAEQLTGGQGAASTDYDNSGAVSKAEEHLEDTNLAADRDTLQALQKDM